MNKVDRTKGVWIILALGLAMGMALTVYLYFDSTTVKKTQWNGTVADSSDYEMAVNIGEKVGGVTYVTGYFFKYNENIDYHEPVVKLVGADGSCYEIPTVAVIDASLDEIFKDEYNYKNGGYEAMVRHDRIDEGMYSVYLYDNYKDVTLDSGISLEVTHE